MLFAGCAKDVSVAGLDVSKPVQFTTSSVNEYVFKSTETALSTGDYIGVFAGSPISRNNVKMRVNGSALEYTNDADRIYWTTGQTVASNFVAYEPWIADGSFSSLSEKQRPWTVNLDQSSDANFYASDLKVANVDVDAEDDVDFVFNHILSKVTLTITSQLASDISQVELVNVISTGTIDLDDGTVTSPGDATSTVVAHQTSYNSSTNEYVYEAIVIPQSGANPSIRITVDGGTTYTYTLSSTVNLTSGAYATASFTILRPGLSAVFSSLRVSSWGSGSAVTVNTAGRTVVRESGKWSIFGTICGTDNDEDFYMTEKTDEAFTWYIDIPYHSGETFRFRYNNDNPSSPSANGMILTLPNNWSDRRVVPNNDANLSYNGYDNYSTSPMGINLDSASEGIYTIYIHTYAYGGTPSFYCTRKGDF